jgi:hypothetical protein
MRYIREFSGHALYSMLAWLLFKSSYFLPRLGPVILYHWFIYNLLINLLSSQSTLVSCSFYIHSVQFTQSNGFCQSVKQTHNSYVQSLFRYYSQHPNCIPSSFSSSKSKLTFSKNTLNFLSILLLSDLATLFAVMYNEADCAMVAAFSSFRLLQGNHWNFSKILGPLASFIHVVYQLCH